MFLTSLAAASKRRLGDPGLGFEGRGQPYYFLCVKEIEISESDRRRV